MTASSIKPPFETFRDVDGDPLEAGYIYIGTANLAPETNPVSVYWDTALTVAASQPIRTIGGYPSRNGTPAMLYADGDYSIMVKSRKGTVIYTAPSLTERLPSLVTPGSGAVVEDMVALRALSKTSDQSAFVLNYYSTSQGGGGEFYYVPTDTTSADNGGTIIVAADGGRWYRVDTGRVSVKDFGAVGDGVTDDTSSLQNAITTVAQSSFAHPLDIPASNYKITSSLTVPSNAGILHIKADNAWISAGSGFSGFMFNLHGVNNNGIIIEGLVLNGNYIASGISIDSVQEWLLSSVQILGCIEGITLTNTYYGEIANECALRNCFYGVVLGDYGLGEVNTINIENLKINFGVSKALFGGAYSGLSTKAVDIRGVILGVKFIGETIEGYDYGFFGVKYYEGNSNSTSHSIAFDIEKCYFEAITISPIYLLNDTSGSNNGSVVCAIRDNYFSSAYSIYLDNGYYTISGNGNSVLLDISNTLFRLAVTTDIPKERIGITTPNTLQSIRINSRTVNANPYKYNTYGNNNSYPNTTNMLGSIEDGNVLVAPSKVRGGTFITERNSVVGTTTKPLTFVSSYGNEDRYSGPVLRGTDNNYYMVGTDGISLTLTRVYNLERLEPNYRAYEALELYRNTGLAGSTVYHCTDLKTDIYKDGSGNLMLSSDHTALRIGTTLQAAAIVPAGYTEFWNAQINKGYNYAGGKWCWGPDWFGRTTTIQAIGLIASRPVAPAIAFMVYYATDTAAYSQWNGSAWSAYTPIF